MSTAKQQLIAELRELIVSSLNLHFIDKETITESTTLMGDGLGLDSVDVLEVVVAVEQRYQVKIANAEQGKKVFSSVGAICDFIIAEHSQRTPAGEWSEPRLTGNDLSSN